MQLLIMVPNLNYSLRQLYCLCSHAFVAFFFNSQIFKRIEVCEITSYSTMFKFFTINISLLTKGKREILGRNYIVKCSFMILLIQFYKTEVCFICIRFSLCSLVKLVILPLLNLARNLRRS